MKFEADYEAAELVVLNGAFAQLCAAGATEEERDHVQLVLLELAQDGVTTVDELIARARDLLAQDEDDEDRADAG